MGSVLAYERGLKTAKVAADELRFAVTRSKGVLARNGRTVAASEITGAFPE